MQYYFITTLLVDLTFVNHVKIQKLIEQTNNFRCDVP